MHAFESAPKNQICYFKHRTTYSILKKAYQATKTSQEITLLLNPIRLQKLPNLALSNHFPTYEIRLSLDRIRVKFDFQAIRYAS